MRKTLFAILVALPFMSIAAEKFVVKDMRVEGLQRISEGTVFNYLPINVGDTLDSTRISEAIRAIYEQDLFDDIELRREGNTLVIVVKERPSIESFSIEGNKDIKEEDLMESLRGVGLIAGRTFDRAVLDNVDMFLREKYYDGGKYGVKIDTTITDRPNNTVQIEIDITEGQRAKIRQVNIVGNDSFDEEDIRSEFELNTGDWLSWIRQDDRYSKEALEGDLEVLRSFYMDRGYADFRVDSTQVTISPNKKEIFVTINVHEGDIYKISEVQLVGELVVPENYLRAQILVQPQSVFNQALLTASADLMKFLLGATGYANAEIEPVPELNHETKEASITFYVDAQSRVYVRNINFNGITEVDDEVLRRELRQMEGAYLSNASMDRSKVLLERLPFIEPGVDYNTSPVPGSADLVDIDIDLDYRMPGQFSVGVGYSGLQKLLLNGSVVHSNFLGSGNRAELQLNSGRWQKLYSLSYTDPYRTMDGVSRTMSIHHRDITQFSSAASDFSTTASGASLDYSYPITDYQRLSFGLGYQRSEMLASSNSTTQARDWVANNGNKFTKDLGRYRFSGTEFDTFELVLSWQFDSRNRSLFATRGTRQELFLTTAVPGSSVEYFQAQYKFTKYIPISEQWIIRLNAETGVTQAMGDTTATPPYKQFYGGGPQSVRGFKESWMGPRDSRGRPYGGNMLVAGQAELIIPLPDKFASSARASFFYDFGNVFNTGEVRFTDKLGSPIEYKPAFKNLKRSVGIAVQWLAPMGLFRFSWAYPLNSFNGNDRYYGDYLEKFQFSVGQAF
ncbi:MAG: outer membrane protein assembly factor BamA [Woeseiaceae bacterium]|nr:outer membrane protein assembly factor BamA [Woeseiaceae bacterium]